MGLPLSRLVQPGELGTLTFVKRNHTSLGDDDWDIGEVRVVGQGTGILRNDGSGGNVPTFENCRLFDILGCLAGHLGGVDREYKGDPPPTLFEGSGWRMHGSNDQLSFPLRVRTVNTEEMVSRLELRIRTANDDLRQGSTVTAIAVDERGNVLG